MNLLRHFLSTQFLKFILVGGVAAVLHWGARIALNIYIPYIPALIIAYCIGICCGYVLNAMFVFSSNAQTRLREVTYFTSFNLAMAPVVIVSAWVLSELIFPMIGFTWNVRPLAHGIGIAIPIFVNFLFHKFYTFAEKPKG